MSTHLRLNQHQVNKQHHKIMLDIFVTKPPTLATNRQPNIMPARLIPRPSRILRPQRLDRMPALDADWHLCCG